MTLLASQERSNHYGYIHDTSRLLPQGTVARDFLASLFSTSAPPGTLILRQKKFRFRLRIHEDIQKSMSMSRIRDRADEIFTIFGPGCPPISDITYTV
jgi:hypothetical protein